jgi:hypothetical protein
MDLVTNGDQGKEGHAVIDIHVFDRIVVASVKGVYPRFAGQLHSFA